MSTSFSEKLIVEKLLQARSGMLFASKNRQKEIIEGLQSMEPGDIRVGKATGKMIKLIDGGEDPLPLLVQLIGVIEGAEPEEDAESGEESGQIEQGQNFADLQQHWSLSELAEIFGCSEATVARWTKGGRQSAHNQKKTALVWQALETLGREDGILWVEKAELGQWRSGPGPELSKTASQI